MALEDHKEMWTTRGHEYVLKGIPDVALDNLRRRGHREPYPYSILKKTANPDTWGYVLIEDEDEHDEVVRRMLAAGVEVRQPTPEENARAAASPEERKLRRWKQKHERKHSAKRRQ